jgi:hypothetical protein
MRDEDYRRWVHVNLPHARTVVQRVSRSLEAADLARDLVEALLATPARGDRLGQHVRNLFECLGLAEEGARLAVLCGERPDCPLR